MVEKKICTKCGVEKELKYFPKKKGNKDGRGGCCNECRAKSEKERREKNKLKEKIVVTHKVCTKCGIDKDIKEFGLSKVSLDGFTCSCKECRNRAERERAKQPKKEGRIKTLTKKCAKCGEVKFKGEYHKDNRTSDGYACYCKECVAFYDDIYRRMVTRAKNEAYSEAHPTYVEVTLCTEWENRDSFIEYLETKKEIYMEMRKDGVNPELDKDLLSIYNGRTKMYSPENCCFLPHEINVFITSLKSKGYKKTERGGYRAYCLREYYSSKTTATEEEAKKVVKERREERLNNLIEKYRKYLEREIIEALKSLL